MLIFVHGGGWTGGDKYFPDQGRYLASRGILVASINYRLATMTRPPNAASDVAAAIGFIHEKAGQYGGDPGHLIVMGHSAGSHLAALAICDPQYLAPHPSAAGRGEGV